MSSSNVLIHWQNLQNESLEKAILKFLNNDPSFSIIEVEVFRYYLIHWVEFQGHFFSENKPRESFIDMLNKATTVADFNSVLDELLNIGIDPL